MGFAATDAEIVDVARVNSKFPGRAPDAPDVAEWLNRLEHAAPLVVYLGDHDANAWTRKAIRQADMVVFGCRGDAPVGPLTDVELLPARFTQGRRDASFAFMIDGAVTSVEPRPGLLGCPPSCITHVALEDQVDFDSLVRFLSGRAIGYVAGGGGSLGSAHVGVYKAFCELGVIFDIFIGTSVGSAMAAGFAKNLEAEDLERGTHDIFVRSRSFRRPTWPRYALLDHKAFDRALARQFGHDCQIEDCWRPFAQSQPIFRPIIWN